ncbi:MAG: DPP IV N-terminal domain-containing protein [Bacteroidales bacterium]|nr:DPP IV N-terminal domain-containing protein [Bacteroidales bacterium]
MKFFKKFYLPVIVALFINISLAAAKKITLEDIYKNYIFYPNYLEDFKSMSDGIHYTVLENYDSIVKYSYETGEKISVIFQIDMDETGKINIIEEYSFSSDESVLLISTEQQNIYRHSSVSNYYVYNIDNNKLIPVFSEGIQQNVQLSPDGRKVAFVYDNNLYFKDLTTSKITQITSDGQKGKIINGIPDWVYEEEFTLKSGYYWSPDSRKIAFYRFDESNVKEFKMTLYNGLYPEWYEYKYPKAGEENSVVDIYVYDLVNGNIQKMKTETEEERYIPRIKWLPDSKKICITTLNRLQNNAQLLICESNTGDNYVLYSEHDDKYLSEFTDDFITFIDSGAQAIIMSERDGFRHLYRYNIKGDFINQITFGNWEVDDLVDYDEYNKRIIYTAGENSPLESHVYSIKPDGTAKTKISIKHGVNDIIFSSTFDYYILKHSDANSPPEAEIYNSDKKKIRVIEDNIEIKERVTEYGFSKKEFFTFFTVDGTILNAYKILPPDFDRQKKYPVLVYVYGGPESQLVLDRWDYYLSWFQLLAQKGYIIVCTDNRGTDRRGNEFKKSTYMQLGKLETEDQIALAEYMALKSYVDSERIGIFGWSYGGYMSLLCLTKGNHIFSMGIAVAPVTNWRYYDTIYTERFMRTPQENPNGYDENSPINHIEKLEGKLLLIHGTADDNVHLQNSMELINKLVDANKQFEIQLYPNKNHGIYGENTTYHLYARMTQYIIDNL